jgi:hypothetical protein
LYKDLTQYRAKGFAALRQTEGVKLPKITEIESRTTDAEKAEAEKMAFEAILVECKDEVARKHDFRDWKNLLFNSYNFQGIDGIKSPMFYFEKAALLSMQRVARTEGEAVSPCCGSSFLVNFNKEYNQCFVCEKLHKKQ